MVLYVDLRYNYLVSNNKSFFMDKPFLCGRERVLFWASSFFFSLEKKYPNIDNMVAVYKGKWYKEK
jgi:hypothetical protein